MTGRTVGENPITPTRIRILAALAVGVPFWASEVRPQAVSSTMAPPASTSGAVPSAPSGDTSGAAGRRGGWFVVPSLTVTETYTDNVALTPSNRKEADLITAVIPGVRIEGNGARAKLSLNYRRHQVLYAGDSDRNSSQNFLSAIGSLEAVERWLFLDAGGTITQQAISAFGSQPTVTENVNANRSETRTYYISPYARGRIGSAAEYEVRYRLTTTSSSANTLSDSDVSDWTGVMKSPTRGATFGWALDAKRQTTHFDVRRTLELTHVRGTLLYHFDPELTLSLLGGQESNNYLSQTTEDKITYGAGFEWTPTPRTRVAGTAEKRFFGDSHHFILAHRTPRSSWQYLDSRTVTVLPNQLALAPAGTAFDLLFNALSSRVPDPVLRAQEVERILQQGGIPSDLGLQTGFLTTRAFVEHLRQASVALLGVRNTITFTAAMSRRESITGAGGAADDFSLSPEIDTRSIGGSWAHRISALSSVNLLISHIQTTGAAATNLETTQNAIRLLFSHRLSPRSSAGLAFRYVRFDSTSGVEYTEKAVTASVSTTF